jgi:GNAT superfamily N-acetyltransferase
MGLLSRDDAVCFLALREGVKVGYLAGYIREATPLRPVRVAELQSMYVVERNRGRGVGARLVEAFFDWARDRQAERLSVTAYAANDGAVRFYQRMGFVDRSVLLERAL